MVLSRQFGCFLLASSLAAFFDVSLQEDSLRSVYIVYRHGDRSQEYHYPADIYTEDDWPRGLGQLSVNGQQQHYNLGRFLGNRYGYLVNHTYDPRQVHILSSDYDRTIMSADANLAAMFPPTGDEVWNDDLLKWQPIPVHTIPKAYDNMVWLGKPCDKTKKKTEELVKESTVVKDLYAQNKEFVDKYSKLAGYPEMDTAAGQMSNIWSLHDPLFCQMTHNFTLPEWATVEVMEKLTELFDNYYPVIFGSQEILRLRTGPFFNHLTTLMREMALGESKRRISVFSAHDVTIGAFMMAMDVFNARKVPYASSLMFELHEIDAELRVKVFYKNNTVTDPQGEPIELFLPGCNEVCTYNEFAVAVNSLIFDGTLDQWTEECQILPPKGYDWIGIIVAVVVIVILVAIGIVLIHKKRKEDARNHYDRV